MSADLFLQGPSAYIPHLMINIFVTLLIYGSFPVIYSKVRKKPITSSKYKWTCYGINLLLKIVFLLVSENISVLPYLIWTSIFASYGIKTLGNRGLIIDPNTSHDTVDVSIGASIDVEKESSGTRQNSVSFVEQDEVKAKKKRYCKECGSQIDSETKKCTGCGKQYFRFRIRNAITVVLLVSSLAIAVISTYNAYQYKNQIEQYKIQESVLNEKIDELEKYRESSYNLQQRIDDYQKETRKLKSKVWFYDKHIVFVNSDDIYTYHKYDCVFFFYSNSNFSAYDTEAAKNRGIRPCIYCCR